MGIIIWCALVLLIATYICGPIQDPDLWWHIVTGRWVLSHGRIPHTDQWGLFSAGQPWRAYSWSNEILYALVERHFGIQGLLALKVLLGAALAFSLFYCFSRIGKSWFMGALLGLYCTAACFNHFTLRPQVTVWICFAWLLYFAQRILEEPQPRRVDKLGFAFVMMVWANSHLSTVLGLLAVFLWLWLAKPEGNRHAYSAAGYAFLGSLITPYLGGEWLTFFHKTGHPFQFREIIEFGPANVLQYASVFLLVLCGLLLTLVHFRPRSVNLPALLGWGIFLIGALAVVKFLPFAVIYSEALVARMWGAEKWPTTAFGGLGGAVEELFKLYKKIEGQGLAFVIVVLTGLNVVQLWQAPLETKITPVASVDFILKNGLPGPVMNPFGQGGYLMFRLSDAGGNTSQPVSIDGRTNLIPEGHWQKYTAALRGLMNWREYVDLVQPKTIFWRNESPLISILLAGNDWCLVHRTGNNEQGYSVLVRKDLWETEKLPSMNCGTATISGVPPISS